jgi:hypothetical protein
VSKRRSRGDGGVHWDERRQRWIATAALGFDVRGKRITRKASGRSKTEAKDKLRAMLRDHADGLTAADLNYTVADAVNAWLEYGVLGRAETTVDNYRRTAKNHIIEQLGARKLRDLTAEDIDRWLRAESHTVSTRTLRLMHSILKRAVRHACRRGPRASCGIASFHCSRPGASASRTSPAWWATAAPASPRRSTATSCTPCSTRARWSWTTSSRWTARDSHSLSHSGPDEDRRSCL